MAVPAFAVMVTFFAWPLVRGARISFYEYSGFGALDDFVGFANYVEAVKDIELWYALARNLFFAGVNLAATIGLGSILAYLLFKRVAGWRFLQVALFIPHILPIAVIALLWRFIYQPEIGLLSRLLQGLGVTDKPILWLANPTLAMPAVSIVWAWQLIPFGMIVLFAAMLKIPPELIESARVDGARETQVLRNVVLPAIKPTVWLLAALITIRSFRSFDLIWIMTEGGPGDATTTGTLFLFEQAFEFNKYGYALAMGFVVAALLGGVLPFIVRRMERSNVEL